MEPMIREVTATDLPFVREMLHTAAFWRPVGGGIASRVVAASKRALLSLLFRGYLAQYHADWGRAGDLGFVAETDAGRVGAVWFRYFTKERHGDAFIDERTPELAIAVVASHRGRGIGRRLIERIHDEARRHGVARIALSVDRDNPAKRLYASLGYVEHEPNDRKGRMVLDLRG